jgi:DNA-binding transcriptional LysR family regulator
MNLDQLQVFVKVVQTGSFTRAAEALRSQKSHLSRVVSQLEAQLGAKLLERSTRSLSVTEIGREVFERAVGILSAVEDTERVAQQMLAEPRGTLRLTCGVEFGMLAVAGWVDEYLAAHPLVAAEVDFTARVVDLVHDGYDLAVRVGELAESRLAARRLGRIGYGLFAGPQYVARRGLPESIDGLRQHSLLMFSGGAQRGGWRLHRGGEAVRIDGPARLRVNNSFAVRDAALRGLGIGQLPLIVAGDAVRAGALVPVLPDWRPAPVPVHAVFPSNRYLTPKVRAFIDLAVARFPQAAALADNAASATPSPEPHR